MRRNKKPQAELASPQVVRPGNLLDLNRSLPGYAYHPPEGTVKTPPPPPEAKRRPWKKILLWFVGVLLVIGLATGGWVAWKLFSNQVRIFGWGGIIGVLKSEKLQGEDSGHVNILLAGNSSDDPNHGGAALTDSIMLLSINTNNNSAFMLSIPRDLYVDIPDYHYAKINEAYQAGEAEGFNEPGYAAGGMGLLAKTVSEHFGLPIHYYALVDYAAVRQGVDAVGGIDVTITSSDPRGLYDPSPDLANNFKPLVKLPNGLNHLNGTQALGLARARGNSYYSYGYALSDFQRTENQRQIMIGLKKKVLTSGTLSNPAKLGELFDSVGKNVKTDLSAGNARRLYDLMKNLPDANIKSVGLNDIDGENFLASYRTRTGQSALIPRLGIDDYSEIKTYVDTLLNPPKPATDTTQKD